MTTSTTSPTQAGHAGQTAPTAQAAKTAHTEKAPSRPTAAPHHDAAHRRTRPAGHDQALRTGDWSARASDLLTRRGVRTAMLTGSAVTTAAGVLAALHG
jgi:hypothetical protein